MAEGKRLKAARKAVDNTKSYSLDEAIALIKSTAKAKFDETVEMSLNLGIDPRHADQMVRGLNIMNFVKEFNAVTQNMEPGMPIPVEITAYADRSFTFITKTPPNTYFLKKAAKIDKGSQTVGKGPSVGRVTTTQLREIAEQKMKDMNANVIEAAMRMLAGSAKSMGLTVVEG